MDPATRRRCWSVYALEPRLLLSQASQITFISDPISLAGGAVSPSITVQLQDSTGAPATAPAPGQLITLASSSAEGFFLNNDNYISNITIPAGASSASFQYQDSLTGNPSLTASGSQLIAGTQQETIAAGTDPFLKSSGIYIRDDRGAGDTVALHGVNLGGYLVMEGWMTPMDSSGLPDDYSVLQTLDNRFGVATEQSLIATYQQSWITTTDLDNIKAMGFNVIRLPFWWGDFETLNGQWRSDAFAKMDWLVNQAWQRGIYTILDFHGVVGGQSGDQSSGQSGQNQYWSNALDQSATATIWERIAAHYKGNPGVAGYDLINEPTGAPSTQAVWNVYRNLYTDIRNVDPDHMIIMEGTFGNWNWNQLPDPSTYGWTNVMYEMHEYQFNSTNDPSAIEAGTNNQVNDFDNHLSWDVPDYVGEFNDFAPGSNPASVWQYTIGQFDANNINWTTWSYKTTQTLAPNSWGVYAPTYWAQTPNIQTDSAQTIAEDWSQWTTAAAFTVTGFLQHSLAQPVPVNDSYALAVNTSFTANASSGVLANDYDINSGRPGIALSATLLDSTVHGQLTFNSNGSFQYTPDPNFAGTDQFRYQLYDGYTHSSFIGSVRLQVIDPPVVLAGNLESTGDRIDFQFSQDVGASLDPADLQLSTTLAGKNDPASAVSFDSQTNTATFTLASSLASGLYSATLPGSGIADSAGIQAASDYTFSFLYVAAGSTFTLPDPARIYLVQQLVVAPAATLDLRSDLLSVQYSGNNSPEPMIRSLVQSAYEQGGWAGPGITSTAADAATTNGVGYFDDGSQVKIGRTWLGDANLNGSVDADDYSLMLLGQRLGTTRWQDGNFNYDTKVNADDWMDLILSAADSKTPNRPGSSALIQSSAITVAPSNILASPLAQPKLASDSGADEILGWPESLI